MYLGCMYRGDIGFFLAPDRAKGGNLAINIVKVMSMW